MIKINIFNLENFFDIVNCCNSTVAIYIKDGKKQNICNNFNMQQDLRLRHKANGDILPVTLDIPDTKDYMRIIFFYLNDC